MKAAVINENGPPSFLRYDDIEDPQPSAGEILVRVVAISIEGGDLLRRLMMPSPHTPHVIGYQSSGEVVAVGAGVSDYCVGDRVTPAGHAVVQRLVDNAARGELRTVIDSIFPLAEASSAHAHIESRAALGRVIMTP